MSETGEGTAGAPQVIAPAGATRSGRIRPSLAWLAPAGLVLYIVLRIPFAIYFDRLGTSPEDAGFGYTQMLAQSSVLVLAIAALGVLATLLAWMLVSSLNMYWHLLLMVFALQRQQRQETVDVKKMAEMSDTDFETFLVRAKKNMSSGKMSSRATDKAVQLFRLMREDKKAALATRKGRRAPSRSNTSTLRTFEVVTADLSWPWRRLLVMLLGYTVIIFTVLPWIALAEADSVRNCEPAQRVLGLSYGQEVQVLDSKTYQPKFPDRELLLLGGDSSRYVLFDCQSDTTIRMPAGETILLHTPAA